MGSCLSPILANLVMEHIEEVAIPSFPHPIKLWRRYVDDTFVIINQSHIQEFHAHLNLINHQIQFTIELENNNKIPFLDVLLHRTSTGFLETSVYRKPTHTNQYLNFFSHQPLQHKASVVKTLAHRARTLTNTEEGRNYETNFIKEILKSNDYPTTFINKHMKIPQSKPNTTEEINHSVTLSYVNGLSENIQRIMKGYKIATHFRPLKILKHDLSHIKDPVPLEEQSDLVYQIECQPSCTKHYIGETKQKLKSRINQHKLAVRGNNEEHSGASQHQLTTGHEMNWKDTKIITKGLHYYKERKIQEAIIIHQSSSNCNRDSGYLFPDIYKSII